MSYAWQKHLRVSRYLLLIGLPLWAFSASAQSGPAGNDPLLVNVSAGIGRVEMTVNASRILTLGQEIPRAQVNNPEIVRLVPLSPTKIQVFGLKAGVTQVILWDRQDHVQSVDVVVFGDVQQLSMFLKMQFPRGSLQAMPLGSSVVLSGYIDRADQVSRAIQIAQEFYPKVINNMTVGGVQEVALHVKVMEVSRTKLRTLGVDFAGIHNGDFLVSGISGLIDPAAAAAGTVGATGDTLRFGIVNGNTKFFGYLNALQQNDLAKVLAEPTLVTVSGRPANFTAGGQIPIIVPQSLGTVSIEYKTYGTQIDFVPIVLGDGRIHLDVRPAVSELDDTRGVTINGTVVPALKIRSVDTGVEMRAGQTLALAGLVQNRVEAETKGLPILGDIPYLGAGFRQVTETNNEIELLILVTPELVSAMEPHEVPPCLPGMGTRSPNNWELYGGGHIEMPACGPCGRPACPPGCPPPGEALPDGAAPGAAPVPNEPVPPGDQAWQSTTAQQKTLAVAQPAQNRMASYTSPIQPQMPIAPQAAAPAQSWSTPAPLSASGYRPAMAAGSPSFIGPVGYDVK